ncbi:phage distal tail protein [Streptosporangium sp. NPDC050855]|uniref:phage distal tail protein n=1 Tax=Streptosporangium sp. NPDC050855 TaxID=3366194 RepID=UPI0037931ED9
MARIGRGQPNRPIIVRQPRNYDAHPPLPVFETAAEFPPLDIFTPGITVPLSAFETAAEFPPLVVHKDAGFILPVFETAAEFPELTITTPILAGELITGNFQIEWGRLLLGGPGNVYQILEPGVEGWDDLPELDSGNAPRSARHGSWTGRDYAQQREVSATIGIDGPQDSTAWVLAMRNFRRAFGVSEDGSEQTLTIRTLGETLLARAKAQARVMPAGLYGQRWTAVSVRWTCSDPRRYDLQQESVTVDAGSTDTCINDGDVATSPRIKVFGPVANPVITNVSMGRILRFLVSLNDGQLLDIDTNAGTVLIDGEDAMDTLSSLSVPIEEWVLAAGTNTISYSVSSGGLGGIELQFRSSYL